ncbi:tyrosine-protein phosphatase non-receptor type substrate 1-like [Suricata suricatta]|nr:tyrosine-protein phosphatase non-receptor type substrate 1-like [Suricata suricatta]
MAAPRGQALTSVLPTLLLGLTAGQPFISLTGPSWRTTVGNPVPFNCTASPFSSWNFNVTWMKGRDERPASAQHPVTNNPGNYFVTSKVWVTLTFQDLSLEITCEVTHRALGEPLWKTMNLSQVPQWSPPRRSPPTPLGRTSMHIREWISPVTRVTCTPRTYVSPGWRTDTRSTWWSPHRSQGTQMGPTL